MMGFERSIATVRWTVACEGLTEQHHNFRQGRKCKRIPLSVSIYQWHVFRPWENPFLSGRTSQEAWTERRNDNGENVNESHYRPYKFLMNEKVSSNRTGAVLFNPGIPATAVWNRVTIRKSRQAAAAIHYI